MLFYSHMKVKFELIAFKIPKLTPQAAGKKQEQRFALSFRIRKNAPAVFTRLHSSPQFHLPGRAICQATNPFNKLHLARSSFQGNNTD